MKTERILSSILVLSMIVAFGYTSMAQRKGMGMRGLESDYAFNQRTPMVNYSYLNLTEEQQSKIKDLRLALIQEDLPLKNQLGEMHAKMQTLKTGDNQDLRTISNLIDEMSKTQAHVKKNAAEHHIAVRALLTDDQKVMFDARQSRQGNRSKGMRGNKAGMRGVNRPIHPCFNK